MTSLDMFAYSNNLENKIVSIPDVKGFYVGYYINNLLNEDYKYLNKDDYYKFIEGKEDLLINNEVNYELIKERFNNLEDVNPHLANPIYIKVIEALK